MLNPELTQRVARETTLDVDQATYLVDRALAQGLDAEQALDVIKRAVDAAALTGWHPSVNTVSLIAKLTVDPDGYLSLVDCFERNPDLTDHERGVILGVVFVPRFRAALEQVTEAVRTLFEGVQATFEQLGGIALRFRELVNPDHDEEL